MKRIVFLSILALSLSSCFKDSYYEGTFNPIATFDYNDMVSAVGEDSVYFGPSFRGTDFMGMINLQENDELPFGGGFALSMKRDSVDMVAYAAATEKREVSPFAVYQKKDGSDNGFAVFYQNEDASKMPEQHMVFLSYLYGTCTLSQCYIANSSNVVANVLDPASDFYFERDGGDYLKLTVTGYNDSKETGKAEYYLVDFRPDADSIALGWKKLDLSKLGDIDYVNFSLESSKVGLPKYFCIDNIVTSVHIKQ